MAKGNPLLGQLRGSVGDVVFTRMGGQQVSRARNRQPQNPQSVAQMIQRARLGSLVQFFTRGQQALFKFAFESKRKNESDYNAFMRYNIKNVSPNTKAGVAAGHPVFGKYQMCQGTLPELSVMFSDGNVNPSLVIGVTPSAATAATLTIGQISAAMIAKYGLQEGDIITKVTITCANTVATTVAASIAAGSYADGTNRVVWDIKQFRLDSTSTALASTLGDIFVLTEFAGGDDKLDLAGSSVDFDNLTTAYGIALIVSRPTSNGVKVSNAFLHCNKAVETAIAFKDDSDWLQYVGQSWKASAAGESYHDAILKGSLSVQ